MQLNVMNQITSKALAAAMSALHQLDTMGATVIDITITSRNPRIRIEPGSRHFALDGALRSRRIVDGQARMLMTANVHGAQVEWEERVTGPKAANA
jgi:hypothetical protein